jgi:DNA-binding response OmpR family regulator
MKPENTSPLKILVVDDTPTNVLVVKVSLEKAGYTVIAAASGEEGIERFTAEAPDVILMDVMMPGIDGLEAARRIRTLAGARWVPIIFLSAMGSSAEMVAGLEAGGDDYLAKPVDLALLRAKMRAMQRIAQMQRTLAAYHEQSEQEQKLAERLMGRMLNAHSSSDEQVRASLWPATRFSGDMALVRQSCTGDTYVLLADNMGHGLAAALPALPLSQVFATMSDAGHTLSAMALKMNAETRKLLPVGHFVVGALARIDHHNHLLEIWNGGIPGVLVISGGRVTHRFESNHLAFGVVDTDEFDPATEVWQWSEPNSLLMFSDGLTEAENAAGRCLSEEEITTALGADNDHERLKAALDEMLEGALAHDDISVVTVALTAKAVESDLPLPIKQ